MSIRVLIIDSQAEFRTLLMHHVTSHWLDANVQEYDPGEAGQLSDGFAGADNDIVLLGSELGDQEGLDVLARFCKQDRFPPIAYFGPEAERARSKSLGAATFFARDEIRHHALIVRLSDMLKMRAQRATTGSLFVGDQAIGVQPLIRGYRFIRKLAVSGHSAVYLSERRSDGLHVVLKVMQHIPDATDSVGAFDRFLQEYELIAELDHPNIVHIYDLGVADDHAHIVMEFMSGGNLKSRIGEGIEEADAVSYLRQIASALGEIHKVGVLHRDLKPGNIMLRKDGSIGLIDFGLAKRLRMKLELTGSGEIFGTPYYMSPEQGHGDPVDARSDIYSLGVIFYEMLTGEKPFQADSAMGIIYKHAKAPLPKLPPGLEAHQPLLDSMLAKRPADRPQIVDQILDAL
ncbi:MAG: protein kinase [Pseudomonadota bacterium]